MTTRPTLRVNGTACEVPPGWIGRRLLDFIRIELGLTGVKEGCGEGDCGACTVLVDGEPMCACLLLCGVAMGRSITTVEGLPAEHLNRFAASCNVHGGVQCGYCTPGMTVMSAWLADGGTETGSEPLPKLLEGNICRCGGYQQLAKAISELP